MDTIKRIAMGINVRKAEYDKAAALTKQLSLQNRINVVLRM
jgi:hypothetical protein